MKENSRAVQYIINADLFGIKLKTEGENRPQCAYHFHAM